MLGDAGALAGLKEALVREIKPDRDALVPLGQSRAGGIEGTREPWGECEQERNMIKLC